MELEKLEQIAIIICSMAQDMDWADYEEHFEGSVTAIAGELQMLLDNGNECLINALSVITDCYA